ncbi:HAD family hydrolase [Candidatus Poribacteria bacterium]|nr:HAD family hydrolase [Candidatus Poribacteria bacterium]
MKALLFDFGGTLDTDGIHWSLKFWDVYQRLGVHISQQEFRGAYLAAESHIAGDVKREDTLLHTLEKQVCFQFAWLKHNTEMSSPALSDERSLHIAAACYKDVQQTIRRARGMLEALRSTYLLGLVSNFYGNLETVCRELNIYALFGAIIDSTIVGIRKPNPQIFQIATQELGIAPSEATVIGDSYERDIVPAKSLGCSTIWLHGKSWSEPQETSQADHIIHTLDDLREFLKMKIVCYRPEGFSAGLSSVPRVFDSTQFIPIYRDESLRFASTCRNQNPSGLVNLQK